MQGLEPRWVASPTLPTASYRFFYPQHPRSARPDEGNFHLWFHTYLRTITPSFLFGFSLIVPLGHCFIKMPCPGAALTGLFIMPASFAGPRYGAIL